MDEKKSFSDIKVAEFAWNAAAPMATKFLADYGATVVHTETHTHLDTLRTISPFKDSNPGENRSGFFTRYESSKLGITLNLNKPRGHEVAMRLIKWADIVVENYLPGQMKKWKLDYETVKQENPGIIYFSSSQQGQTGPFARFAGYGGLSTALSGFYYTTGLPTDDPVFPYAAYTDFLNPPISIALILAALDYRRRTGQGTYIDQSQAEVGLHFLAPALLDYDVNKHIIGRTGNRSDAACPHGVYPCLGEDRWIALSVFDDAQWASFCKAVNGVLWTGEEKFKTFDSRKKNEDDLDRNIGSWTRQRTAEELLELMQAHHVPAGIVKTNKDLFDDPQLAFRKHFIWLENEEMGRHAYEKPPFIFSEMEPNITTAPVLGEDNEYVYRAILGYNDDDIGEFLVDGVITTEADLPEYSSAL